MEALTWRDSSVKVAISHIVLLTIAGAVITQLPDPASTLGKTLAGFFIASVILLTKEIIKYYYAHLKAKILPTWDKRRWASHTINVLMIFGLAFMSVMALLGWYASWEGKTGVLFGLGFLVAAFATDFGVGKVLVYEAQQLSKARKA